MGHISRYKPTVVTTGEETIVYRLFMSIKIDDTVFKCSNHVMRIPTFASFQLGVGNYTVDYVKHTVANILPMETPTYRFNASSFILKETAEIIEASRDLNKHMLSLNMSNYVLDKDIVNYGLPVGAISIGVVASIHGCVLAQVLGKAGGANSSMEESVHVAPRLETSPHITTSIHIQNLDCRNGPIDSVRSPEVTGTTTVEPLYEGIQDQVKPSAPAINDYVECIYC